MRWSYKTVRFDMKKEGLLGSAFLDESEIEITLNEFGEVGWELVSLLEVDDGIIAVFKQPFTEKRIPVKEYPDEKERVADDTSRETPQFLKNPAENLPGDSNRSETQRIAGESEQKVLKKKDTDVGSIRIE